MLSLFLLLLTSTETGRLPPRSVSATQRLPNVQKVMPTTSTVHENLLRFSIRFSHPTGQDVLKHLTIIKADGNAIDEPFLNQELWSADGKTLTVLFGPGRVKTGLVAHDILGRPLHIGDNLTLQIDGKPIAHWAVTQEWIHPIEPKRWRVSSPHKGSHDPLQVRFPQPIDGMDADLILVVHDGEPMSGHSELTDQQTLWTFTPQTKWFNEKYTILVHPHLEDPYGNEVGSAFEAQGASSPHTETEPTVLPLQLK